MNPSFEYMNGGPAIAEITGHIDVKDKLPADPTLLFVWHSPHYGGRNIQIRSGEPWSKVIGPFLYYCNTGDTPDAMWKDAVARARREQKHGPTPGQKPQVSRMRKSAAAPRPAWS